MDSLPPHVPATTQAGLGLELLTRLTVTLGPALVPGEVPAGQRRVIPITGGAMVGPGLRGEVLPGGADWFVWRPGDTGSVSARYSLRTDDGVVLGIVNEGTIDPAAGLPFTLTAARIEAPVDGPYAWLNSTPLVGSLVSVPGDEESVTVELWRVVIHPGEGGGSQPSGSGDGPGERG